MKSTNQRNNEINISTSTSTNLERNPSRYAPDHCRDCNLDANRNLKSDPVSLGGIAFKTTWWFIYARISCFLVLFVGRVFFFFFFGFGFLIRSVFVLGFVLGTWKFEKWVGESKHVGCLKKKWWRKKKESKNSSLCSAWILNSPQLCQHIELESLKLELRQ